MIDAGVVALDVGAEDEGVAGDLGADFTNGGLGFALASPGS